MAAEGDDSLDGVRVPDGSLGCGTDCGQFLLEPVSGLVDIVNFLGEGAVLLTVCLVNRYISPCMCKAPFPWAFCCRLEEARVVGSMYRLPASESEPALSMERPFALKRTATSANLASQDHSNLLVPQRLLSLAFILLILILTILLLSLITSSRDINLLIQILQNLLSLQISLFLLQSLSRIRNRREDSYFGARAGVPLQPTARSHRPTTGCVFCPASVKEGDILRRKLPRQGSARDGAG
jgi:hypothetical protein